MARGSDSGDITVLGGGPVGLIAALCLAADLPETIRLTVLTGRRKPASDGRAAALVGRSVDVLRRLDVADVLRSRGADLTAIRIIDVTGRLLRAPTTLFRAQDVGLETFGFSVELADIVECLVDVAKRSPRLTLVERDAMEVRRDGDIWTLTLDDGTVFQSRFLVAADGQKSKARDAAGLKVRRWQYDQVALTFAVRHRRDHGDISTEFHTAEGPFTLVPGGDRRSTVVWMTGKTQAEHLMALDEAGFARAAERTCQSLLGAMTLNSPRGAYPMGGLLADDFSAPGLALVGETGHAFPPIGAQGLNLGIRDADTLSAALKSLADAGGDLASPDTLRDWNVGRKRDVGLRTAGVDAFNRSLLTEFLPAAALRGAGLAALKAILPLRQAVMRAGLG